MDDPALYGEEMYRIGFGGGRLDGSAHRLQSSLRLERGRSTTAVQRSDLPIRAKSPQMMLQNSVGCVP